jgi:nucleoid-associated protein YgaU
MRAMGNETDKPDFTSVQSTVTSSPAGSPDFGNVESQLSSRVDRAANYIVETGDSLSKIAKHFYGNANAWKQIFEANRDQLSDPDRIKPGQILRIPPKP